jgi:hypothetical protein
MLFEAFPGPPPVLGTAMLPAAIAEASPTGSRRCRRQILSLFGENRSRRVAGFFRGDADPAGAVADQADQRAEAHSPRR